MKQILIAICSILMLNTAFSQNYSTVNVCYYHNDQSGLNQVLHTTDTVVWSLENQFNGNYFAIPGYFVVENASIYPIVNENDTIIRIGFDPIQYVLLDTLDTVIVHIVKQPEICLVSGYTSGNNRGMVVSVDSSTMVGYDTVYVQRETAGVFSTIGTIIKQEDLTFVDTTVDFSSQAYTYRLTNGYCGDSEPHTSIHLQTTGRNLNWTNYVGLDNLAGFFIWRKNPRLPSDTVDTQWEQIGTTSNINVTSYTDNSSSYVDSAVFLVEAIREAGCNTNTWKTNETEFASGSVRSNVAMSVLTGVQEISTFENSIYPNPATSQITIRTNSSSDTDYLVYDATGRMLASGNFTETTVLDINAFLPGIYIVQLSNSGNTFVQKIIKQ